MCRQSAGWTTGVIMVIFKVLIETVTAFGRVIVEFSCTVRARDPIVMYKLFMSAEVIAILHALIAGTERTVNFYGCIIVTLSFAT